MKAFKYINEVSSLSDDYENLMGYLSEVEAFTALDIHELEILTLIKNNKYNIDERISVLNKKLKHLNINNEKFIH